MNSMSSSAVRAVTEWFSKATRILFMGASAILSLQAQAAFDLPVEVLGVEGTTESQTFSLSSDYVNNAEKIFFMMNNLGYENKGSIQINGGAWISLNHTDIDIYEKEMYYGGMQHGGMNSIRFTIPSTALVAGENTINFRFDVSNGISMGYRVIKFNLLDTNGAELLPESFFVHDDPDTWGAPAGYDSAADVTAGQDLWYNGQLVSHNLPNGRNANWYGNNIGPQAPIKAKCTDCHTQNGRDLEYFSYSNRSIIERSKFHGLTDAEGSQIAAYIRSLDVPRHGRPWNPPYQPGPELADKPIEYWAAGAGLDAVLETDADMLAHMLPNGTSQEEVDKFFDQEGANDTTIMPVSIQFPDWKHWLPLVHPKDAFDGFYSVENPDGTFSAGVADPSHNPFVSYPALRAYLLAHDHNAIVADKQALYDVLGDFWKSFRKFFTKEIGKGGGWRYSNAVPDTYMPIQEAGYGQLSRTSVARLMAVKFFEVHQEFQLEELIQQLEPAEEQPQPRQWLHASGYNIFEVPPHFTAGAWGSTASYEGQPWITGVFETTSWYELQLIINPGNGKPGGTGPVDFNYHPGFISKASGQGKPEPMRYARAMSNIYQVKGVVPNPDPSKRHGFRMLQMGPTKHINWNSPNLPGTEFIQKLEDVETGLTAKIMSGLTSMMADALHHPQNHPSTYGRSNSPSQFKLHPETKMDYNPNHGKNDYSDIFYQLMPEYLALGVDPLRVDRVIDWAETAWPLMPWDDIRPFPSVTATAATESINYSANLASFISDIDIATAQSITKINGPQWLIVGSDGSLSGFASNGSVGPNSFTIEIVDSQGVSHLRALKVLVDGSADAVTHIAQNSSGGHHLGELGADAALSDMTAESLAVDGDRTSAYSQWVSDNTAWPHWIEIELGASQEIMKLEFWSGEVVSDFQFQQWNGSSWVDIIAETGNTSTEYSMAFTPVTTSRVRLYATAGIGNVLSLKEINVYIEEVIEVNGDEDGGEGTTEIVETNVAVNKPTTVDSGAGLIAGPSEEWNVLPASAGYVYLQNRLTGERLSAVNADDVELVASSVTGDAVEWQLVDIDGTWNFILSKLNGRKLHAKSNQGFIVNLVDPQWTGANQQWSFATATVSNQAPAFNAGALSSPDANEEVAYSGSLAGTASDADGDTLTYSKVSGPGWLTIAADGTLGGTPLRENVGLNSWVVAVDDGNGVSTEVTLVIDVIGELRNLALNQPVQWSSHNRNDQKGAEAVDGVNNDDNKWVSSNVSYPHWIEIDFEGSYTIEQLKVWHRDDGTPSDFRFQHWNGSSWVDIINESGNSSVSYTKDFAPVTTTQVRYYATAAAAGSDSKLRILEMEVYGKEPSSEVMPPNIAASKPVTTDSDLNGSYSGANAVDGDNSSNSSRWVSANTAWPHWIEIDLQGSYDVSRVKFWTGYNGYENAPTDFQFQRWNGSAWVDVFADSGNTDPVFSRTFAPVTTDRVRLYATAGNDNYFRLYEIEVFGEVPSGDTTPPGAPTGLVVTAGENTTSLDWADNGESDFASYSVYRSTTSGSGYTAIASGLTSSSYNDSGLTNGTTYYYAVTASDGDANESSNSAEASATPVDMTPPAAPSSLTAAEGIGAISLDWSDNGESDFASYTVYRSTTSGSGYSVIASGVTSSLYDDTSVSNHVDYYYVVTAIDATGNESNYSAEVQAQAGVIDYSADSETAVLGTVSGGLAQVESHDDLYQTLTEAGTGNTSGLEHKWEFNVTGAELVTFYVEAHRSATAGSDDFIFAWSTDDVNYTDMLTVSGTIDDDQSQYFMLPSGQTGTIYIRVLDSDRSASDAQLDTLTIDALYIVTEESSAAPQAALSPDVADGATDVAINAQLSWFAGLGTASHDVYFGTNPTPGAGELQGNQVGTSFDPGALEQSTTYYWRVDEVNASGTTTGPVWSFTTIGGLSTFNFNPVEDSYTKQNKSGDNFGTDVELHAKVDGSGKDQYSYIKFNVSGVSGSVSSAKLRLYTRTAMNDVTVHAVNDNTWTESTLTWSNQPSLGTALETLTSLATDTWIELDVSSFVTGDGTYTLGLSTTHSNNNARLFDSREGINVPVLELTTDTVANSAPTFTADPISTANATGNVAYSATISGSASDADSDPLTYSKVSGPAWLSVATGGALSGIPAASDAGGNVFTVEVSDGNGGSDTATLNITVDPATYTLSYTAGGNGSITGTSSQTVDHGSDGSSVTAVAATGYSFVDWSDGSTANPRTDLNVTSDVTVTANFAVNTYALTYTAGANGSITGASSQSVDHGSNGSSVTAVADTGYSFVDWSDGSTANPRSDLNVTGSVSVTANFTINTYALTYTAGANGSISGASSQTVDHGSDGSSVTAVAATGYSFVDWSDGSTANPRTDLNVTGDITVTANFEIDTYTLTYTAGANGSITGTSPQTIDHGSNGSAVTAVADANYSFVDWSDGSTENPRTDLNVTGDITVTANFAINTYALTYIAGANGSITGTSPQTVDHGSDGSSVTAVADTGYSFVNWSDGSTANPRSDLNVAGDVTVTANFAINTYTLTYIAGANGSITGASPQTVDHGSDGSSVTAVPATEYYFVDWSDGRTDNPRSDLNVSGDITVTANFATPTAFNGPHAFPGRIEAEDYDDGIEGYGYHDTTPGNSAGAYRSDDVDVEVTGDTSGAYNITNTAAGEWLEYLVENVTVGDYLITLRAANAGSASDIKISIDGIEIDTVSVPNTGGAQSYTDITTGFAAVISSTDPVVLSLEFIDGDINVNRVDITVAPVNNAPAFTSDPFSASNATEGAAYSDSISSSATDADTDPITYSKVSGPAWLSVAADGTLSGTPATSDIGANAFIVQATDGFDFVTATLNITVDAAPAVWVELTNDDFESGIGNWVDGGSDARLTSLNAIDTQCVELRDNTDTSVITLANSLDLSSSSELRIEFSYVVSSFEGSEDFWVQYSSDGGSSWTTVQTYVNNVDFVDDGTRYNETVTLDSGSYTFNNNVKVRFRCDASGNGDDVYIDNVVISGLQ